MPYTPDQLPFSEFEGAAKRLKRQIDHRGPHYPVTVVATTDQGVVLVQQTFHTPHARPEIQVVTEEEWEIPVPVKLTDAGGAELQEVFFTVIPRERAVQLEIPGVENDPADVAAYQEQERARRKAVREFNQRFEHLDKS